MDLRTGGSAKRFLAYVAGLVSVIGHADRARPLRDYCTGLLMPVERKSVKPMVAVTAPDRTVAQHQSLLHFVGEGRWSDETVLAKVQETVLPKIEDHGPIEAWIIDNTGFPKKDRHSVGVARQYCGQLGKQDNCQVAVSLSLANHEASLPVAYRLYLPEEWAGDAARRRKAHVPKEIGFKIKPEIALEQIRTACDAGLPRGVVLMDAGYGANTALRCAITALGLSYAASILPNTTVWVPGMKPLRPKAWSGRRRPPKLICRDSRHRPIPVKALALSLPAKAWRTVTWREGTAEPLTSRFARLRVRAAHRDYNLTAARPEEWLVIEWPKGEALPTKYWFSTLPEKISFTRLVDLTKLRWRIERDYQDLKQEIGLGHFEGRGLARLSSSRHALHRRLRLFDFRAGNDSPPQARIPAGSSKRLVFPRIIDPAVLPLRTERHIPNSIATMRRRLAVALASQLSRCPCCARPIRKIRSRNL